MAWLLTFFGVVYDWLAASLALGADPRFVARADGYYVLGLVLSGAAGAVAGSFAMRRRRRSRLAALVVASAAVIAAALFAEAMVDFCGHNLAVARSAERPHEASPRAIQAARLATLSPRYRAEAMEVLQRMLVVALCEGPWPQGLRGVSSPLPAGEASRCAVRRELLLVQRLRGAAGHLGLTADASAWWRLEQRAAVCAPHFGWIGALARGDFVAAWSHSNGALPWALVAAGRFQDLARLDGARIGHCAGAAPTSSGCRQAFACWHAYLEARGGDRGASRRLLEQVRAVVRSGPRRSDAPECLLLAADLLPVGQRSDLLKQWVTADPWDHSADAAAWVWMQRYRQLLWVQGREQEPSRPVPRNELVGADRPFTALDAEALAGLDARPELSPQASLERAGLLWNRALWLERTDQRAQARRSAQSAIREYTLLQRRPVEERELLVLHPADRERPDPAFRDPADEHTSALNSAWYVNTVDELDELIEQAKAQLAGIPHPRLRPPPAEPTLTARQADVLVADFLTGRYQPLSGHGVCLDVHEFAQRVTDRGALERYPELSEGAARNRDVWLRRDRALPLLLLGYPWQRDCALE